MKFIFKETNTQVIMDKIMSALGGRELGKMVNLSFDDNNKLIVSISKFGTSTLIFQQKKKKDHIEFYLEDEKIAFTHLAFKDEVKNKLSSIIEKVGGSILS